MKDIIVKQIPFTHDGESKSNTNIKMTDLEDNVPYGVSMINAPYMWEKNITGKNVTIAVIDTGCDLTHPDLKNQIIGGRNFTSDDNGDPNKYQDYNGHGTHVCGTIAASKNKIGVVGIAPNSKLLILKALDRNGSGSLKGIMDAISYAITKKVDIISMSLGTSKDAPGFHELIKSAIDANILVVCAVGNEGDGNYTTDEFSYPGGYNEVISVGAVDNKKSSARFSDSNKEVDVVAPGVNIISTYMGGGYSSLSGTSMATPHVTGALALLIEWSCKEFGRRLSEAELYGQLIKYTTTLSVARTSQGNGIIYLNPAFITK